MCLRFTFQGKNNKAVKDLRIFVVDSHILPEAWSEISYIVHQTHA